MGSLRQYGRQTEGTRSAIKEACDAETVVGNNTSETASSDGNYHLGSDSDRLNIRGTIALSKDVITSDGS